MIEQIHIKDVATFKDEYLSDLKKVNFIYGSNGSGKTTISNVIKSVGEYKDCELSWNGGIPLSTLVYNKSFKDKNFGTAQIPGVFTLGSATKEEIAAIEDKKKKLENLKEKGIQNNKVIENQQKELELLSSQFKDDCWKNIKLKHEKLFKDAFVGCLNSKERFCEKVKIEFNSNNQQLCTFDDLINRAKTLFDTTPEIIEHVSLPDIRFLIDVEENPIWEKKILGKADIEIAPLIQRLNLNDWVNQGRQYIMEDSDICPFCQKKTIDKKFKEQIEEYFNETFINDTNVVKNLSAQYISGLQLFLNELSSLLEQEKINKNTKLNIQSIDALYKSLNLMFSTNREILSAKEKEPSRSLKLESIKDLIEAIIKLIEETNNEIKRHNQLVANFQKAKNTLIADIWKFILNENADNINTFVRKEKGLTKGIEKLQKDRGELLVAYQILDKEIKEDNKKVTSVQSSVDEINKVLTAYGFTNFTIVPVENNSYQIQRANGELVRDTLSEGEITFITFLYFMQLVRGGETPEMTNDNRVVVIDDPISSLDSTILFVVSSLIKEEIKRIKQDTGHIKQLIILTHNIYFHKEVSFIDGRTKSNNDTYYWIVRKINNESKIQCYQKSNPIRGSYELLWDELKNKEQKLSIITIQNTMRRIYETYFKILGKYSDDDILDKFNNVQEKEICRSLLCWINDGSHCVPDDFNIVQSDDITERYYEVFQKIFKVMGHIEHYNMMMEIESIG